MESEQRSTPTENVLFKSTIPKPTHCKMCSHELTSKDSFAGQGYCHECAKNFTRQEGITRTIAPQPTLAAALIQQPQKQFIPKKRCNRCGDFGHISTDCRTKICSYCDARGHTAERCFSDPNNCCEKCGIFGHKSDTCVVCERCGDNGHNSQSCRTKICEDCGKRGHVSESCWHNMTCDRCGIKGHIADACRAKLWCEKCKQPHKRCSGVN